MEEIEMKMKAKVEFIQIIFQLETKQILLWDTML